MKAKAWYGKFPLDAYALGPARFDEPISERQARSWWRRWEGCKRLPRGFQCWPTNDPPPR